MICNVCGKKVEAEDSKFCEYCGSPLEPVKEQQTWFDKEVESDNSSNPKKEYSQNSNFAEGKEIQQQMQAQNGQVRGGQDYPHSSAQNQQFEENKNQQPINQSDYSQMTAATYQQLQNPQMNQKSQSYTPTGMQENQVHISKDYQPAGMQGNQGNMDRGYQQSGMQNNQMNIQENYQQSGMQGSQDYMAGGYQQPRPQNQIVNNDAFQRPMNSNNQSINQARGQEGQDNPQGVHGYQQMGQPRPQGGVEYQQGGQPLRPQGAPEYQQGGQPLRPQGAPGYQQMGQPRPQGGPGYQQGGQPLRPQGAPEYQQGGQPSRPQGGPGYQQMGQPPRPQGGVGYQQMGQPRPQGGLGYKQMGQPPRPQGGPGYQESVNNQRKPRKEQKKQQMNGNLERQAAAKFEKLQTSFLASAGGEDIMSVTDWIKLMALGFIPIVGPIMLLIKVFTWAFKDEGTPEQKNWAKATLVIAACAIILGIILTILFIILRLIF